MSVSQIQIVTAGSINKVNDTYIGGQLKLGTDTSFGGQLGKVIELDDSQVIYTSAMGTVYGGSFQYVRLAAAATAVVVGQIVFWDISVADNLFQVTTSEAGTTVSAALRAGIVLNSGWSAGSYSFIQILGPTYILNANPLSNPAATGASMYCGGFGAGANNGTMDVLAAGLQQRYLGTAIGLPVAGAVSLVNLNLANARG